MNCRGCGTTLRRQDAFCDLGSMPLANALLTEEQLDEPEMHYPLRPLICSECLLVQLPPLPREDIFTESYPFFSGQSSAWLAHCERFVDEATSQYGLGPDSRVLEIGSNDGSMLRPFRARAIPALGIEPCESVAQHALQDGLATIVDWWGVEAAEILKLGAGGGWRADLVIANNVLAHVPDLQDFLCGVRAILEPERGVAVFEVAYLGDLISGKRFDQIYAEHYSYFSLNSLCTALQIAGLRPCGVEFLPVHGGSIRVTADVQRRPPSISALLHGTLESESHAAWHSMDGLRAFSSVPPRVKYAALKTILEAQNGRRRHSHTVGYGASAKAIAMLAYLGLGAESIEALVDTTPAKQGHYTPGTHIPIVGPEYLVEHPPDTVVNFLWNWRSESEVNIRTAVPEAQIIYTDGQTGAKRTAVAI